MLKLSRELLSKKNSKPSAFSLEWEKLFRDQNCPFNLMSKQIGFLFLGEGRGRAGKT